MLIRVSGFRPYLYVGVPDAWDDATVAGAARFFERELATRTDRNAYFASKNAVAAAAAQASASSTSTSSTSSSSSSNYTSSRGGAPPAASLRLESWSIERCRKSLMGFSTAPVRVMKLVVNHPDAVRALQDVATAGVRYECEIRREEYTNSLFIFTNKRKILVECERYFSIIFKNISTPYINHSLIRHRPQSGRCAFDGVGRRRRQCKRW